MGKDMPVDIRQATPVVQVVVEAVLPEWGPIHTVAIAGMEVVVVPARCIRSADLRSITLLAAAAVRIVVMLVLAVRAAVVLGVAIARRRMVRAVAEA